MPEWIEAIDDELLIRRQQAFRGGANEFDDAATLGDDTVQRLTNRLIEDNGRAWLRPGADALGGSAIVAARIECMVYLDTPTTERLLASVSASLRSWDGAAWTNIAAYPFGASSIIEMCEGAGLVFCSTGAGQWYTWSGAAWSGALGSGATDPPNGASIMCWHTNRMFATGTIGSLYDQIYASDIGAAGTGNWQTAFGFRVGRGEGQAVTALCSAKSWWLAVGKEGSIYMVNTDPSAISATAWPIRRVADNVGVVGKRAMIAFGDFLCVFTRDGVRKIQLVQNEDNPWELGPPLSEPMQTYINRVNWASASRIVLHKFRHYLLCAVPLDSATECSHVLVWNARLNAWMGVWTNWTPTSMITTRFASVDRLVIGDTTGRVNQWKDYAATGLASTYQENGAEIPSGFIGKGWHFDFPANWKDGRFAEVIFEDSSGSVDVVAYLDGIERRRETFSLEVISNQLPLSLPFDLAIANPEPVTMALDELPEFRELAIGVDTTSKQAKIKSVAVAAFLNTVKNE